MTICLEEIYPKLMSVPAGEAKKLLNIIFCYAQIL